MKGYKSLTVAAALSMQRAQFYHEERSLIRCLPTSEPLRAGNYALLTKHRYSPSYLIHSIRKAKPS